MTYNKPEILVLGDASRIIQTCTPKSLGGNEVISSCGSDSNSAYDLDE